VVPVPSGRGCLWCAGPPRPGDGIGRRTAAGRAWQGLVNAPVSAGCLGQGTYGSCRDLGLPSRAMDNRSPILRFGILSDGKRSSYWRVRAGVARPELFLERESFGKRWHFSLHASGRWHMKEGGQERISWARPDEIVSGYTRAVAMVQPVAVAHRDDAAPEGVEFAVATEAEPTTFSVFIEWPEANMGSWPGKNAMGTVFVGRIPLAGDAGTCCIVARQEPLEPGEVTLPRPSDTELPRMREVASRGTLLTTVIGSLSDGAIALIDLCAARDAFAPVDPGR